MLRLAVAIAALTVPSAAFAGWGGAEWGMSREDVASVRGQAPERDGDVDRYRGTVGSYAVGLIYKFDGTGLIQIEVSPQNTGNCLPFMNAVRETYGAPFLTSDSEFISAEKWQDVANGNLVNLFSLKADEITSCHVLYEPLKTPNSGGF